MSTVMRWHPFAEAPSCFAIRDVWGIYTFPITLNSAAYTHIGAGYTEPIQAGDNISSPLTPSAALVAALTAVTP